MSMEDATNPGTRPTKPGWYNDPDSLHSHQAYWDGEKWTGETRDRLRWTGIGSVIVGVLSFVASIAWWGGFVDELAAGAFALSLGAMLMGFLVTGLLVLIGHLLRHSKSSRSARWLWTGFGLAFIAVVPLGGAFEGL